MPKPIAAVLHPQQDSKTRLAASSPVFQNILRQNKHPHPVIFLRSVNYGDLVPILDFLYKGEARVLSENLESFLAIADDLKMKELAGKRNREFLEREHIEEEIKGNESIEKNSWLESSMKELPGQRSKSYLRAKDMCSNPALVVHTEPSSQPLYNP